MTADRPCDSEPPEPHFAEVRCQGCGTMYRCERPHGNMLFCMLCVPPNVVPFPYGDREVERFDHLRDALATSLEPRIPGWKVWSVAVAIWAVVLAALFAFARRGP